VNLVWTVPAKTTDRQLLRDVGPTFICRGLEDLKNCGKPVATTPPQILATSSTPRQKHEATYVDFLPESTLRDSPDAMATYAVEVLNQGKRGAGLSNQAKVSLAHTLPPPTDFQAKVSSHGIILHWTCPSEPSREPGVRFVYRVYRSLAGAAERTLIGDVPISDQRDCLLTDANFEWQKTYEYHAETVTVIEQPGRPAIQVEGDDTPDVRVFADDVFPPAVPSGLQAVFSGPGQKPFIDLIWAPVPDADLAGYNVYRHEPGGTPARLNTEPVRTPAYRDTSVETGKTYLFSVSSLDLRGNESARSEEASESVP